MDQTIKMLLIKAVILPFVLKVFQNDKKLFEGFKMKNVYFDKLDAVIESVQDDLNEVRRKMYSEYHIDISLITHKNDHSKYQWKSKKQSGIMQFSSEQLREQTKKCMEDYLYGSRAKPYDPQRRSWY